MMFKYYFLSLLISHILADFYLQTNKLVEQKEDEKTTKLFLCNIKHALVYLICEMIVLFPVFKSFYIIHILMLALIHFIIDSLKSVIIRYYKQKKPNNDINRFDVCIFIIDQVLHMITIIGFAIYFDHTVILEQLPFVKRIESIIDISYYNVILVASVILLNGKSFNIFIKKVFYKYQPNDDESNSVKGAGGIIGFIERLLIALLYYNNQFAIIGLVITAKSVARYKKITDDMKFAEYYLMGTLSSTLFSVISVYFINWIK